MGDAARAVEGSYPRKGNLVRRFGENAQIGDYVWHLDASGRYRLCRIDGPYRYDGSDQAKRVDCHHVRDVEWARDNDPATPGLNDSAVPGGVIRAFGGGPGQEFVRIHDEAARRFTPHLWAKLHGEPLPKLEITPREVLTKWLGPYEVEDLVYVWEQVAQGHVALRSPPDTHVYEWTMIIREAQRRCIVQVKSGETPVDLEKLAEAADDETDTYAFATCGRYVGDPALVTKRICVDELLQFVAQHPDVLPSRVRHWFEWAAS